MHLQEAIKIYDDVLPVSAIASLIKWLNLQYFENGLIGDKILQKKIRDVKTFSLNNNNIISQTKLHWYNLIGSIIANSLKKYTFEMSYKNHFLIKDITEITVLKYEKLGHYDFHVDHIHFLPRTLSCILLLNNDYEGGQLKFATPEGKKIYKEVDVKPGRLIIFPSNFLYPHKVTSITNGVRYSIVAWAF